MPRSCRRLSRLGLGQRNRNPNLTYPSISPFTASYNRTDGSFGFKFKPYKNLIVTANLLVKLDQGGLRARDVPLDGLSVTF
jgi:hypothetical protein